MQHSMDILEDETGQVPERQRSIRAVMDYSWQIMNDTEQTSFMKLSVFRGGFTREAAQVIADANLRILMSLTTKSLIRRNADTGRYQIHELLRQYAEEKVNQSGLATTVRSEHAAYYLDFVAQNTQGLKGGGNQFKILDALDDDFDNIQVAWNHAALKQDADRLGNAIEGLELLCNLRSHFDEAQQLFDIARKTSLPEALKERVKIRFTGSIIPQNGLEQALEAAKARGDKTEVAYCLVKLGEFAHNVSQNPRQAIAYWEEATALYRNLGEAHYLAETLMKLSDPYQHVNDYQKSGSAVQESYEIQQQHRDDLGSAKTFRALSMDTFMRGDYDSANVATKQAYDIYFRAKNPTGQAETLLFHGWVNVYWRGDGEEGCQLVKQSFQLAKDTGLTTTQAWSATILSVLLSLTGDIANAEMWLKEAEAIEINPFQQTGGGGSLLLLLMTWAKSLIALEHNNYDEAQAYIRSALEQSYQMHGIGFFIYFVPIVIVLYTHDGKYVRAVELLGMIYTKQIGRWLEYWPLHNNAQNSLKQHLGETVYNANYKRGQSMDIMEAVKQILDELTGSI